MKMLIILMSGFLFVFQLKAQEQTNTSKITAEECTDLVQYRDTQLIKVWDKTIKNYKIPAKAIADLNKYKEQLTDDTWYATTNLHVLTLTLKLASNTVEDMLKIIAPLEAAASAVILSGSKWFQFLDRVNKGKEILGSEDVEKTMALQAGKELAALTPYMAIPLMLDNLSENLNSIADYSNVKSEVNLQMGNFDKAIKEYNIKVNSIQTNLVEINEYKLYIDRYLNENCKSIPVSVAATPGKKAENSAIKAVLLATYKNENGQWIAMGPYNSSKAYSTEKQALDELYYAPPVLVFLCERGKYKIYKINEKTENVRKDVRNTLIQLGVKDIPE